MSDAPQEKGVPKGLIAGALVLWLAVFLIQKFNWGLGLYKGAVALALLAAVPFLAAMAIGRQSKGGRPARSLVGATLLLLLLHAGYALKELRHPALIDAATTTLTAGAVLGQGASPYASPLDPVAASLTQDARFAGYKYLPLTIIAYLPLGRPLGERGVVATNLVLHLATVWLVFRLGVAMAGRAAGWFAALLYLSLPLVPFQLFAKGAVDLVAVLPLLAAMLLAERHAGFAGLCLGVSLAAKLLPGVLLLPCCLPASPRARLRYGAGIAIGLAPVLPFVIASPGPFFANIAAFNLIRPADSTSWLVVAPPLAAALAKSLVAALYVASAAYCWRRPPPLAARCGLAVFLVLATLLAAPAVHHNYQLWWLPVGAALLSAAVAPWPLPSAAAPVYESGTGVGLGD